MELSTLPPEIIALITEQFSPLPDYSSGYTKTLNTISLCKASRYFYNLLCSQYAWDYLWNHYISTELPFDDENWDPTESYLQSLRDYQNQPDVIERFKLAVIRGDDRVVSNPIPLLRFSKDVMNKELINAIANPTK